MFVSICSAHYSRQLDHFCAIVSSLVVLFLLSCPLWLVLKRRKTRLQLSSGQCKLPTVCWMPKFINYSPERDDHCTDEVRLSDGLNVNVSSKKLSSSNITNILPRMERLGGPYGMYATVYGISTKVVHVAHPIPAKAILADNQSTLMKPNKHPTSTSESLGAVKSPAYDHFKNFSGDGVFTADGSTWKAKRTSVLHCLLKGCTKDDSQESQRLEEEANIAADCFISNSTIMEGKKETKVARHVVDGGVNVVPLLQRATIGLIYRFITHHNVDVGIPDHRADNEGETKAEADGSDTCASESKVSLLSSMTSSPCNDSVDNHDNLKNPFDCISSYLEAITNIRMIILAQSRSIWFLLPRWMYRTFSSMYREEEKQMVAIRQFARAACTNAQPGSPLQMLRFKASHNPHMSQQIKEGTEINKELLDEAITLLFAGQDTSAATLSWTLHLLSLHPKIQTKVAKEVHNVLKEFNHEGGNNRISKKMISKMTFLDAVVKESMRLYPVAPFVVRRIPYDLTIPPADTETTSQSTVTIPQDTFACIWIYGLHRNPLLWHRPDDFLPERWIDPSLQKLDDAQTKFKGTFMPFAFGPRNCVGQPLAQSILRIILARIMNECQVIDPRMERIDEVFSEEEEMLKYSVSLRKDMQAGFTVLPSGGVRLIIGKRHTHEFEHY